MARFIARRLVFSLPVLFGVTVLIYVLLWFAPGDPALSSLGIYATPEQLETLRQQLDLDKPIYVLYARWLGQIVRGDFGVSLITKEYVSTLIRHSLSITIQLTAVAMVMVVLIAFPTGIISAVKRNSISDMLSRVFSLLGISMPNFWLALLFITFIAVGLGWFPPGGYVSPEKGIGPWLQSLILPALSIAAAPASALSRMVRASMLDVLSKDYIRTARAKGQRERWVVLRHALRNSLMAPMTIIGMQVGYLMGGAIIVEVIFFFPGMGRLLLEAGIDQDYSVVQGVALVSSVAFILVNVLVDFLYMLIDPRIRDS